MKGERNVFVFVRQSFAFRLDNRDNSKSAHEETRTSHKPRETKSTDRGRPFLVSLDSIRRNLTRKRLDSRKS